MRNEIRRRLAGLKKYLVAWRYLAGLAYPHKAVLVSSVLLLVVAEYLYLPNLWVMRHIVDTILPDKDVRQLLQVGLFLLVYNILRTILPFYLKNRLHKVSHATVAGLRNELMAKVLSFPHHYFMENDRAILQTRIVLETDRLSNSLKTITTQVVSNLAGLLILIPFLMYISLPLFLASMIFLPALYFATKRSTKDLFARYHAFRMAMEQYGKATAFAISLVELIKFRSTESLEQRKYGRTVEALRVQSLERDNQVERLAFYKGLTVATSTYFVLIIGGWLVAKDAITLGAMFAFILASRMLQEKFKQLQNGLPAFIEGNQALQALHALLADESREPYRGTVRPSMDGEIRLQGISFAYQGKKVLQDASLVIGRRSFVALLGANGSGKTTLTRMVLGLYRPDTGHIHFDGIPAEELDFPYIRSQTGIVPQHPQLIEGTVLDNIRYGYGDIPPPEVEKVCRMVLADAFIRALPEGYDTYIGENGTTLSGGERQKIAFARSLVSAPRLLILDEPTNHLDRDTVGTIIQNLRNLQPRPSLLLITHDPSIIDIVDEVYHLENGFLARREPITVG